MAGPRCCCRESQLYYAFFFSSADITIHRKRAKGLPLIILIRLSPFPPWAYANAFFAVSPVMCEVQSLLSDRLVHRSRRALAVCTSNNYSFSEIRTLRTYWIPDRSVV
jgi:hypothetical protein